MADDPRAALAKSEAGGARELSTYARARGVEARICEGIEKLETDVAYLRRQLTNEKFDLCLAKGKLREDAFGRILTGVDVPGKDGKHLTVEVKTDVNWPAKTKRLCIEFRHKGHRSGIATTESYYYAIEFLPDRWVLLPTTELRDLAIACYRIDGPKLVGDEKSVEAAMLPFLYLLRDDVVIPTLAEKEMFG